MHTKKPKRTSWHLARGITMVELMVVVGIIAVIAGVAVWSMTPNINESEISDFAGAIQNSFKEARSRASSSGRRYAVQITDRTVIWCENDCPPNQPTTCDTGRSCELGRELRARGDARAISFARVADIGLTALPARTSLGTAGVKIYFFGDGTADADLSTTQQEGFTVYLQHQNKTNLQYRVAVLPLSGDIRKYTEW